MNKKQMVLAAVLIFTTANLSQAQTFYPALKNYSAADKKQMDKRFAHSLSLSNNGIVASALAVITMMKLDLPADEFPMIMDRVYYLAAHGATPMIRYRACLAEAVFANPEMFKAVACQFNDPNAFFNALDHRTTEPFLSSK